MARSNDFNDEYQGAASQIGDSARVLASHARRAAHAATSEAARAVKGNRETMRAVFDDLAEKAEAHVEGAEKKAAAIADRVMAGVADVVREGRRRPVAAVAVLAGAAIASALVVSLFARR